MANPATGASSATRASERARPGDRAGTLDRDVDRGRYARQPGHPFVGQPRKKTAEDRCTL